MNKHDDKLFNDYKSKVEWYFTQEWSEKPFLEVLYDDLKEPKSEEVSKKNMLLHEKVDEVIWESWTAGSNIQSASYFVWLFFKRVGKFEE
jgi:hypothetical protein